MMIAHGEFLKEINRLMKKGVFMDENLTGF